MSTPEKFPFDLEPGERVLWSGAPRTGFVFRSSDIVPMMISLVTLYVFATMMRNASFRSPIDASIAGVIFVAVMYFTIGRFFFDAFRRRKSAYALTSERMLVRESLLSNFVKSFPLNTITDTGLRERGDGFGDIWIRRRYLPTGWQDTRLMPTRGHPIGFAMVPDARRVYDLLEEARLTRPAPTLQTLFDQR
jgi:hypothetical protein